MKKLLAASIALLSITPFAAHAADRTLTISVYGFAQDAYKKLVYDPFEAKCGCKLVVETGNSVERLAKMEANKANPVIDMAVISMADALQAARKADRQDRRTSKLSNYGKLYDIAKDPNGDGMSVGYTFYATSIAYRSDKMKITSWADLLKPEYVRPRRLPEHHHQPGPAGALHARQGGGQGHAGPEGAGSRDRRTQDDIVTFYERGSQIVQLMQQEEIWAAPIGRFGWAGFTKLDLPIKWATPKEGQTGGMNVHDADQGHEEPGSGAAVHGFLALDRGADRAGRRSWSTARPTRTSKVPAEIAGT
jgi:putative spermidine/putrescine transport system substrate-binding protein